MHLSAMLLADLMARDAMGVQIAAIAVAVLAAVLAWHAVAMAWQGRWREWTCWSAGALAVIACLWVVGLLVRGDAASTWSRLILLTGLAVAAAVIFYVAVFQYLGAVRILILLSLRCVAIGVLVILLFKPALVTPPAGRDRPTLVLLLDRSESMSESDAVMEGNLSSPDAASFGSASQPAANGSGGSGGTGPGKPGPASAATGRQAARATRPRLEAVLSTLAANRSRLERFFNLQFFAFDKTAEPIEPGQVGQLAPIGEATLIDIALATISPAMDSPQCRGAILFSDGGHNGAGSPIEAASVLKRPLVTVCVGGKVSGGSMGKDLAIDAVSPPDQAICKNVAAVSADISSTGLAGQPAVAVLRQAGGEELARAELSLTDKPQSAKLEFTPRQVGLMDLELAVGRPDAAGKIVPLPGETVSANNYHAFTVRVGEPKIKVLYVDIIRPEEKYLVQTLRADPQIQLVTLLQVTYPGMGGSTGPRFVASGKLGEVQLPGFPTTAEQFKMLDVIILGDLDRTYLNDGQMRLAADWVRGGKGLLMIGGSHSFGPGGFGGTPIEQVMPVEFGPRTIGQENKPFKLKLTQQGRVHPIFGGLADMISPPPASPASPLPELTGCAKVVRAKPAGQVLAVHGTALAGDGASPLPVLVVQSDSGRSAAFSADTTYQWLMHRTVGAYEGVHQRFWGQLVRWLASSELVDRKQPSAAVLNLPRSFYRPDEPIPLAVHVWDQGGLPADGCRVTVKRTDSTGRSVEVDLPAVADQTGLYRTVLPPQSPGSFTLSMTAAKAGAALGAGQHKIEIGSPGAESVVRSANPDLLAAISRAAPGLDSLIEGAAPGQGGDQAMPMPIQLAGFSRLVDQLVQRQQRLDQASRPEQVWPAYDNGLHGLAMAAFALALGMEWLLRRRWQLQ